MDLLAYLMAKKAAGGDAAAALEAAKQYSNENLATAKEYTDDAIPACEEGTVTLTNTEAFPFNNSLQSVALVTAQEDTSYVVITEVVSSVGDAGEINISDKQTNGFKMAYTGGATSATVHYFIIGGIV